MYNLLKGKWNKLPSLAANQHFPKFRYYLERGGKVALTYIEENADLVETVLGGSDEVQALKEAIAKKNTAHENQVYFVREAKRLESQIKAVLRAKYNALQGYCEQESLPWDHLTPETLLPATRRAVEAGEWDIAETELEEDELDADMGSDTDGKTAEGADEETESSEGSEDDGEATETEIAGEDAALAAEAAGSEQSTDENSAPKTEAPAEGTEVETAAKGEETLATETEATPETSTQSEEDELRAKIASLNQEGLNKTEIWAEVKPAAEAAGWSRTAVWAYVDELAE